MCLAQQTVLWSARGLFLSGAQAPDCLDRASSQLHSHQWDVAFLTEAQASSHEGAALCWRDSLVQSQGGTSYAAGLRLIPLDRSRAFCDPGAYVNPPVLPIQRLAGSRPGTHTTSLESRAPTSHQSRRAQDAAVPQPALPSPPIPGPQAQTHLLQANVVPKQDARKITALPTKATRATDTRELPAWSLSTQPRRATWNHHRPQSPSSGATNNDVASGTDGTDGGDDDDDDDAAAAADDDDDDDDGRRRTTTDDDGRRRTTTTTTSQTERVRWGRKGAQGERFSCLVLGGEQGRQKVQKKKPPCSVFWSKTKIQWIRWRSPDKMLSLKVRCIFLCSPLLTLECRPLDTSQLRGSFSNDVNATLHALKRHNRSISETLHLHQQS